MTDTNMRWWDAFQNWQAQFEKRLSIGVKELFEKKHLYQNVAIDMGDTLDKLKARLRIVGDEYQLTTKLFELRRTNWVVVDPANPKPPAEERPMTFTIPDVKLFCERCDRTEPFNLVSAEGFLTRGYSDATIFGSPTIQVFAVSFLCQSCKRTPEVFLIRRAGEKLTLCGRAPMEVAHVPKVIPKNIHGFYSGAIIAYQSGQTLAAIFMLRTVIEQWARSKVQNPAESGRPADGTPTWRRFRRTSTDGFRRWGRSTVT